MIFISHLIDNMKFWKMYKDERIALVARKATEMNKIEDMAKKIKEEIGNIYASISLITWDKEIAIETDLEGWKEILVKLEKWGAENDYEKWVGGCYIAGSPEGIILRTVLWILPDKYSEAIDIAKEYIKPFKTFES